MNTQTEFNLSYTHGVAQLLIDAISGMTYVLGSLQRKTTNNSNLKNTQCVGQWVNRYIHSVATRIGEARNPARSPTSSTCDGKRLSHRNEALLSVLNGVLGDHLFESSNPLAIPMRLRRHMRRPLIHSTRELAPHADKLVVLVHGLCMNDLQWCWHDTTLQETEQGESLTKKTLYSLLANELNYTPVYLHYNTGRHISINGREFTGKMESMVSNWPVPVKEIVIIANSMGGLVTRSACHYGSLSGHHWLKHLKKLFFIGTPHHGSPLERIGNWVDTALIANRVTAPLAHVGKLRSAGITDLRYGNLLDEDWVGRDRFERTGDPRSSVPLPKDVQCFAIAATRGKRAGDLRDRMFGDGLVPLNSALGRHPEPELNLEIPDAQQWIGYSMGHLDLISQPVVSTQIKRWLGHYGEAINNQ